MDKRKRRNFDIALATCYQTEDIPAYDDGKEEEKTLKDEKTRILRLILKDTLTTKQKAYFSDYYCTGLKMHEIAKKYGISTPSVSKAIATGKKNLERELRHSLYYFLR